MPRAFVLPLLVGLASTTPVPAPSPTCGTSCPPVYDNDVAFAAGDGALAFNTEQTMNKPHVQVSALQQSSVGLPAHVATKVPGMHGYATPLGVTAGEEIRFHFSSGVENFEFHISSSVRYTMNVYRVGDSLEDRSSDELIANIGSSVGEVVPVFGGSYMHIEHSFAAPTFQEFSLEAWVRIFEAPTSAPQGIMSMCDGVGNVTRCPFAVVFQNKSLCFVVRGCNPECLRSVELRTWVHIVASVERELCTVYVDGLRILVLPRQLVEDDGAAVGRVPLRIGAIGNNRGEATNFMNGDVGYVALYPYRVSAYFVTASHSSRRTTCDFPPAEILGCWNFHLGFEAAMIADWSIHNNTAVLINEPEWNIFDPNLDIDECVQQCSPPPHPHVTDAHGGFHSVRFSSEHLFDCRWSPTFTYAVPKNATSGFYVGRLEAREDDSVYDIAFIVRSVHPAPILVLASVSTWMAYNSPWINTTDPRWAWDGAQLPSIAGQCSYYAASPCQSCTGKDVPCSRVGLKMPLTSAMPYMKFRHPQVEHNLQLERHLHIWLNRKSLNFHVVPDTALHTATRVDLASYKIVIISGHSEYWSREMYTSIAEYLAGHGNVISLSGNTMYWRVSFSSNMSTMESRKAGGFGGTLPCGMLWHGHDGLLGGMMRRIAMPAHALVGLDFVVATKVELGNRFFGLLAVDDHWLLNRSGVRRGERLVRGIDGWESDASLQALMSAQELPSVDGWPHVSAADVPGLVVLARGQITDQDLIDGTVHVQQDYFGRDLQKPLRFGGEIIFWEREDNGKVLAFGSIYAGPALLKSPKLSNLVERSIEYFSSVEQPSIERRTLFSVEQR